MDYIAPLTKQYEIAANPEYADRMKKYLKNLFPFYGLNKQTRTEIDRAFFKDYGLPPQEKLFEIVYDLWEKPEREYQHFALTLLKKFENKFQKGDIRHFEKIIISKSWWDTVDAIAAWFCGTYFKKYTEDIVEVTSQWMASGNMWLQRSALLFQLKYKLSTDTQLMSDYIKQLSDRREFFIRKAIGWVLREYSKTNPGWVRNFIRENTLSGLSYREASKYI